VVRDAVSGFRLSATLRPLAVWIVRQSIAGPLLRIFAAVDSLLPTLPLLADRGRSALHPSTSLARSASDDADAAARVG